MNRICLKLKHDKSLWLEKSYWERMEEKCFKSFKVKKGIRVCVCADPCEGLQESSKLWQTQDNGAHFLPSHLVFWEGRLCVLAPAGQSRSSPGVYKGSVPFREEPGSPLTSFSLNVHLKEKRPKKVDDFSYLHRMDQFY